MAQKPKIVRLLPCTGAQLAEAILNRSQAEYREEKSRIQAQVENVINRYFLERNLDLMEIIEWEREQRSMPRNHGASSFPVTSSVRYLANALLTSGQNGFERSSEKFQNVIQALDFSIAFAERAGEQSLLKFLKQLQKIIVGLDIDSEMIRLYREVDPLRKEKNAAITKTSRIRRIADVVLTPTTPTGEKLSSSQIKTKSEANDWLQKVARQFIAENPKLNRFNVSYEKHWDELGTSVIEVNEDTSSILEEVFIRSMSSNPTTGTNRYARISKDATNDFLLSTSNASRSSDRIGLELKVRGNVMEAHFALPKRVSPKVAEIQLKVLTLVQSQFKVINLSVTSESIPSVKIVVACKDVSVETFGQIQLAVLKFLETQI